MSIIQGLLWGVMLVCVISPSHAKVVKYAFDINTITVNYTGKSVEAIAIHNQIPAPTIEATVGDILEVTFHNKMDEDTSIHWHGVLLPNDQDGVPYLTTPPIKAHSSFTYRYTIKHAGTYWYHSHTELQEQRGVYGSLVFRPKGGERVKTDRDYAVVLSDWTDENPQQVLANLKKDGDYYALKKDSVQSWWGVLENGAQAIKNRIRGAWIRMGPMDISDIGYDAFLANGKQVSHLDAKPGETVRIRLINAAASSYFYVEFAGEPMTIVSADGVDVESQKVKRLRSAIAETYDVIVKIPDHRSYELRATSEDGTGYSSTYIGKGQKVSASPYPKPNLYLIDHSMHGNHDNQGGEAQEGHDMSSMQMDLEESDKNKQHKMHNMGFSQDVVEDMSDYEVLRAVSDTSLPKDAPTREVELVLTGNMERYVWGFNNKTLLESDKVLIRKGENVRFVLRNETMMHHPMHLHGHFFRVLNGQGEHSPLKHTVNIPPMDTVAIEFEADEEKDWFFHCHNLYHMEAGMARVISYEGTTQASRETFSKIGHDNLYFSGEISALSNMTAGILRASNTRNAFEIEYDYNYEKEYDIDIIYERSFTRYFDVYAGANLEREDSDKKPDNAGVFGFHYVLPLLIESDLRVDTNGHFRFGLSSDLQFTDRTKFEWMWNTDKEYRFTLSYEVTKTFLITGLYDSDFHWGGGIRVKF
jgi:FtsP/CotA-like multicopper oxidase with cupredoxin domain